MNEQDLNPIATFAAVVAEGSISTAATRLGVAKSTVSQHLAALEQRLGVRLLERTTRSIRLTAAGKLLLPAANRLVAAANDARLIAGRLAHPASAHLRVLTADDSIPLLLEPILRQLSAGAAMRGIELIEKGFSASAADSPYDLDLKYADPGRSGTPAGALGAVVWKLYAAPGYLRGAANISAPGDLASHRFIVPPPLDAAGRMTLTDAGGARIELSIAPTMAVSGTAGRLAMAVRNWGIAALPEPVASLEPGLAPVLPGFHTAARVLVGTVPSVDDGSVGSAASAALAAMLDGLRAALAEPMITTA